MLGLLLGPKPGFDIKAIQEVGRIKRNIKDSLHRIVVFSAKEWAEDPSEKNAKSLRHWVELSKWAENWLFGDVENLPWNY